MLEHESVDADGVLSRTPLSHAYAGRWAKVLEYPLLAMSDVVARYGFTKQPKDAYYTPGIEAGCTFLKVRSARSSFALYLTPEPLSGRFDCSVGMWGEPFSEDQFQALLLSVRDLPYSVQVVEKLIEKSDWLDLNPMYRGLPGVAGRHLSVDQLEAGGAVEKPANWDW